MADLLTNEKFNSVMDKLIGIIEKGIGNSDLFRKVGDTEIKYGEGDCSSAINDIGDKVNEGEVYSTEEQVIGTWVDGQKIYKKTYVLSTPILVTQGQWVDIINNLDIGQLINCMCRDHNDTNSAIFPIVTRYYKSERVLKCFGSFTGFGPNIRNVTITYTKS